MTKQNVRGAYMVFTHDRAADWDWLAKWQPNVIRLMMPGNHNDPASVDVNRIRRVHETVPDALLLLRVWDVDDRNFEAHNAMVADPRAEAERQLDWWARLFDRVQSVPRNQLMAGLNNETGPEKDAALYDYTQVALLRGKQLGVRCGALVFSVGRPSLSGESQYDMNYFSRLEPLFLASDHAMLLHEYMQPEGMQAVWTDNQGKERKDYSYLIGRHKRWPLPRVKKIIAEWGIDGILYNRHPDPTYGNSGWRNFRDEWTPDRYADEYVACVQQADDSVIGICPFLSDYADRKWASFDLLDAYSALLALKDLCVKDVQAPSTPTTPPVVVGTGPTPPTVASTAFVAAPAGANVRVGPGLHRDKIETLPYGTKIDVEFTEVFDFGGTQKWARLGDGRWVAAWLLSATKPSPQPVDEVTPQPEPEQPMPQPSAPVAAGIIEPRVAQAILKIESGGRTHGEDGRIIIRFEAHVFKTYLPHDEPIWKAYFRTDSERPWTNQEWRKSATASWQQIHTGNQADEYAAFDFARGLYDPEGAYKSISMGSAQIMGFNHARIGYESAAHMYAAFIDAQLQTIGFINFCLSDPALADAMRRKDWREIAKRYNGAGAVDTYAPLLEKAYKELGG